MREPKRFDPGDFDSEYKLNVSKEIVCKDDRLNASVIEKHLIPPSIAFCLSEEGTYTEDLVNDKRAFKVLKIQDQALKHLKHLRKKFPDAFRMLRAFC